MPSSASRATLGAGAAACTCATFTTDSAAAAVEASPAGAAATAGGAGASCFRFEPTTSAASLVAAGGHPARCRDISASSASTLAAQRACCSACCRHGRENGRHGITERMGEARHQGDWEARHHREDRR